MDSLPVPEIGHSSRDQKYRHSLQPKSAVVEPTFRHTQSHNYGAKRKKVKKTPPPAIPELELAEDDSVKVTIDAANDNVKLAVDKDRKHSRHSRGSRKASQASGRIAFDNIAFEPEKDGVRISRNSSAANSIRSSREPSVHTVVREQYCCCSRWTPCERALFAAVGVLVFIIIILVIAVILVAVQKEDGGKAKSILGYFDLKNL
ncbi:uncharacterized protein BDFB_009639 [Asbolus verrucosus]|uniref:Uncharacterized protein n=1 Tax=Asbolus verrucosus TaxID=1661398 RepID=A0A482W122_ASBVE|nr:uncharacterized protein BDFB_009639 [Asbolus verrucosus]